MKSTRYTPRFALRAYKVYDISNADHCLAQTKPMSDQGPLAGFQLSPWFSMYTQPSGAPLSCLTPANVSLDCRAAVSHCSGLLMGLDSLEHPFVLRVISKPLSPMQTWAMSDHVLVANVFQ